MKYFIRNLFLISIFLFFVSCSQTLSVKEVQTRNQAKNLIIKSFPKQLKVKIYSFENLSTNFTDEDYLSHAIPEMILSYLKPLEMNQVEIPLELFTLNIPDGLEKQILELSNLYSNYLTNVTAWVTQYQTKLETNELWKTAMEHVAFNPVQMDNSISNIWQIFLTNADGETNGTNIRFEVESTLLKPTNIFYMTGKTTNRVALFQTNVIGTNADFSDKLTLTQEAYLALLTNEFQDALSNLSLIPVQVEKKMSVGQMPTNYELNTVYVGGTFEVTPGEGGPSRIKMQMRLVQLQDQTNELVQNLEVREDEVADRVYDFVGPLRKFVLKKPGGEIFVSTDPKEVSVYLDGVFIGKTPVRYPYVLEGEHQLLLRHTGFGERYLRVHVDADVTNWVNLELNSLQTGGRVEVSANPANTQVFLDSRLVGSSPLVLSNLTLNQEHRIIIRPITSALKSVYWSFTLTNQSQHLSFSPKLLPYEGTPVAEQRNRWIAAYSGWTVAVGLLSYSIYEHYQREYFSDLYSTTKNPNYQNLTTDSDRLTKNYFNYFVVGSLVASYLTKMALDSEQVYIGLEISPERTQTGIAFRF